MNALETITIAQRHIDKGPMASSAKLALDDAIILYNNGLTTRAHNRALKSIAYSVGILHPDYIEATK